ncbi:histidine kinase [Salinimicrobium sp. TIG7-5_MAKvit]|uniref:sensor histidine kinase n=1 Tax=Salinimicrobium sp. TIG7-5_MAKvit TaxID=3121289 RepID=UPI003C6E20AB
MKIKEYKPFLVHLVVWLIFLLISLVPIYSENDGTIDRHSIVRLCINFAVFYINYLYLVPYLLLKKKTYLYLFCAAAVVILPVILFDDPPPPPAEFPRPGEMRPPRRSFFLFIPVLSNLAFLVAGTSVRVYLEWNENEMKKKEIENQKSKAELYFLRNQLSPHFLFNSLNSIYSLSAKKSDYAPEAIITLSELMRYMLYQTDSELVLLKDELDYIQNYLKLQRLRIANNENVTFNIKGPVSNQKIRPLLLISLIENAFKYGTDFQGNTEVKIKIIVSPNDLKFICSNIIGHRKKDNENAGIGLKNTRSRLELLYPQKHEFIVEEKNNRFIVQLHLDLTL